MRWYQILAATALLAAACGRGEGNRITRNEYYDRTEYTDNRPGTRKELGLEAGCKVIWIDKKYNGQNTDSYEISCLGRAGAGERPIESLLRNPRAMSIALDVQQDYRDQDVRQAERLEIDITR